METEPTTPATSESDVSTTPTTHEHKPKNNWIKRHPILSGIIGIILFFWIVGTIGEATNKTTPTTDSKAQNQTTATATDTPSPEITEPPTATPKPTLTTQQIIAQFESQAKTVTVANIYKSPNSYKDNALIFTCSVSGFPKDDNGDVAALNCIDPNNYGSNVQIAIDKKIDVTQINQNDTIKVYGMGMGAVTGKNAFGADITTGEILGLYINDLTTGYKNY